MPTWKPVAPVADEDGTICQVERCPICSGKGKVRRPRAAANPALRTMEEAPCPVCCVCPICSGTRLVNQARRLDNSRLVVMDRVPCASCASYERSRIAGQVKAKRDEFKKKETKNL